MNVIEMPLRPAPILRTWYAKTDTDTVIATGSTFDECSAKAAEVMPWEGVAPFYLSTLPPRMPELSDTMRAEGDLAAELR